MSAITPSRLPLKRSLAACIGLLCAGAASAQSGDVLAQWREYARRGVMPEYAWADTDGPRAAPTLFDSLQGDASLLRSASLAAVGLTGARLSVGFDSAGVGDNGGRTATPRGDVIDFDGPRNAIRNDFVSSTYEGALGQRGRFGVTAIVARQRFASDGLGAAPWSAAADTIGVRDIGGRRTREESTGHGMRVGYWAPLDGNLAWSVGAQSKIEMDAFRSFRGVYAEAGDFDVPGRVEARLSWAPLSFATLSLGVDRVYYSDIDAFTSAALPTRFLSLLGDGGSPAFAWRDLTVYSIEGTLADRWDGRWSLRYTSTQQPEPTSELLQRALRDMSSNNVLLGYSRGVGQLGEIAFNASYSADTYFLGAVPYTLRDFDRSSQFEVEAVLSVPF